MTSALQFKTGPTKVSNSLRFPDIVNFILLKRENKLCNAYAACSAFLFACRLQAASIWYGIVISSSLDPVLYHGFH